MFLFLGEYVVKEIETLYALKKYRAMKKRYYDWFGGGSVRFHVHQNVMIDESSAGSEKCEKANDKTRFILDFCWLTFNK